jgi:uncharacterized protein (TIGR03118 family)
MSTTHVTRFGWLKLFVVVAAIAALGMASPIVFGAGSGARDVVLEPNLPADVWQENLVSDMPGVAMFLDDLVVNPMGIEMSPLGFFVVANNGTGVLTVHEPSGLPLASPIAPLVVTVPPAPGGKLQGAPTGVVLNHLAGFSITSGLKRGRSLMLLATQDGLIQGWNPYVEKRQAIIAVDRSATRAAYFGLDVAMGDTGPVLAAADFRNGKLDLFDENFTFIRSFTDPSVPKGYAPFNVRSFDGRFYVTFALRKATPALDFETGRGLGIIDVFNSDGSFDKRLVSNGPLNAPWALVKAPEQMHDLAGMLLVGNVGDGKIYAIEMQTGFVYRILRNEDSKPAAVPGLFGIAFSKDFVHAGDTSLYFTAGIENREHGLIGRWEPLP